VVPRLLRRRVPRDHHGAAEPEAHAGRGRLHHEGDELHRTIAQIEVTPDYDVGELVVAMENLYHHLNTARNSRDEQAGRLAAATQEDVYRWRRFPEDIRLGP